MECSFTRARSRYSNAWALCTVPLGHSAVTHHVRATRTQPSDHRASVICWEKDSLSGFHIRWLLAGMNGSAYQCRSMFLHG